MGTQLSLLSGELSPIHWSPARMELEDAVDAARVLETVEYATPFWIGDFLCWAKIQYGEDYTQLIPEGKADTWRGYEWTCGRVAPAIRKHLSGYTQARAIASLTPERQDALIRELAPSTMTTRELTDEVKKIAHKGNGQAGAPSENTTPPSTDSWPVSSITWGEVKHIIDRLDGIDDDTPICLTIGPATTNLTVHLGKEGDKTVVIEGWDGHDGPAGFDNSFLTTPNKAGG